MQEIDVPALERDVVATVARAFVLLLQFVVPVTAVMLALGVFGFAIIAARAGLVPRWSRWIGGGSAVSLALATITGVVSDTDLSWLALMVGVVLLLVWLAVAGGWLLLGGTSALRRETPPGDELPSVSGRR